MRDGAQSEAHASRDELVGYVTGALLGARAERLEAHVGGCEACAAALEREAVLEAALGEVCAARRSTARVARIAGVGFASLAAAAAVLLALGAARGAHRGASDGAAVGGALPAPRPVSAAVYACADGADGEPCGADDATPME